MRHELVHLALNARAGGDPLPGWFHEGLAVSIESGWRIGDRLRLTVAASSGLRWTMWLPIATSASALWGLILALAFVAFFVRLSKRARRRRQWDDEAGTSAG